MVAALFQSLLFEACGRTVNPVNGAVGLLWTGNWHVCQSAVETVLRGGVLRAIPEFSGDVPAEESSDDASETYTNNIDFFRAQDLRKINGHHDFVARRQPIATAELDLGLTQTFPGRMTAGGRVNRRPEKRRAETPSQNSDESETTSLESGSAYNQTSGGQTKLLRLFV